MSEKKRERENKKVPYIILLFKKLSLFYSKYISKYKVCILIKEKSETKRDLNIINIKIDIFPE